MIGMVTGWQLSTVGITGDAPLEIILAVGVSVIVFALGFSSGNTR
jgi:hypothetical protein